MNKCASFAPGALWEYKMHRAVLPRRDGGVLVVHLLKDIGELPAPPPCACPSFGAKVEILGMGSCGDTIQSPSGNMLRVPRYRMALLLCLQQKSSHQTTGGGSVNGGLMAQAGEMKGVGSILGS